MIGNKRIPFYAPFFISFSFIMFLLQLSYAGVPPYPQSQVIERVTWDFTNLVRLAPGSDLWPFTWAADDNLYTSWGDGGGFGGTNNDGRVSLGFARVSGLPSDFTTANVWGGKNPENPATFGGKTAGMISVGGVLYAWLNIQNASPPDHKLIWSSDMGKSWQISDWKFPDPDSPSFFPSTFLNYGKDNAGTRDSFIYIYGARWIWTQGAENSIYLARVDKNQIKNRNAYEFFAGLDTNGNPKWVQDIGQRQPVFTDPNGVANTGLASVVFNAGLGRYILTVAHRPPGSPVMAGVGQLGIFDAPEPWGPWTTVAYYDNWGEFGNGEALIYAFPTKWISPDGKMMWMVFSSTGILDSFNLIKGTLILKTLSDTVPPAPPKNVTAE